jgi:putative copper resistance protein D
LDIGVWDVGAVVVKAALYATTFAAAGGAFFVCYAGALLGTDERRAIGRGIEICAAAAVAFSALRILVTAGSMTGDATGMFDTKLIHMVWHSGEDSAVITRIAGLLLGHAHATGDPWTVACIALHVGCAAFWIGALGPLAFLARRADPRRAGAAASRFGQAAVAAVGALVLAGVFALARFLGHASALWESPYGWAMCVKLALVAGLLSLAAFNKIRLTPRLSAGDTGAARSLERSIYAEMVLAALILLVTATITTLIGPPALE